MTAPQLTIMQGDALDKLRELPSESVQLVITSPPYWGLRDYKVDGQLGLENTPEEYISHLVEIFKEVKRVLRSDGVVWLNLGDSYYGSWGNTGSRNGGQRPTNVDGYDRKGWDDHTIRPAASYSHSILKPKDQCLIPHRVAIALQADGWWVRQTIIWNKPNPMPESCVDRCTSSHEYIFHLTKSAKYFYDQEAIREAESEVSVARINQPNFNNQTGGPKDYGLGINPNRSMRKALENWAKNPRGRNKRSVWTITTRSYPEAHFATFPPELPEICIKAGTSLKGCCPKCGAPWGRVVKRESFCTVKRGSVPSSFRANLEGPQQAGVGCITETLGWKPTCSCGIEETIPCTVLDPFAGSGTTGEVARELGRSSILIELNPEYIKLIKERTKYDLKAVDSFV